MGGSFSPVLTHPHPLSLTPCLHSLAPSFQAEEVQKLVELSDEFIPQIQQVRVALLIEGSREGSLKILNGGLKEADGSRLGQIMEREGGVLAREFASPVLSQVDLYEGIHRCI